MANYPIYRLVKGTTLTFTEMDDNLRWLSANMSASVVTITGSTFVLGNLNVSDGITASLFGTSSWAVSASYVLNAVSASYVSGSGAIVTNLTSSNDANINGLTVGRGSGNVSTNVVIGISAASVNNTGKDSVVIGYEAGKNLVAFMPGNYADSVLIGFQAGYSQTTVYDTVAVGWKAGFANIVGKANTYLGTSAAYQHAQGNNNVFVGAGSAVDFKSGSQNTVVGYFTFRSVVSGSNNTVLGSRITGLPTTLDNNIILADGQGNIKYRWDGTQNTISGGLNVTGGPITGSNAVLTGTLTVQTIVAQTITASTEWITGSSKFGSLASDTHEFTGSVLAPSITGSLHGTSSWAVSASWAPSSPSVAGISSYISSGSVSASVNTDISASFRVTSGSNTLLNVTKDGFVWIGNGAFANAGYQLDVQGAIRATTSEFYYDIASFGSTYNSRRLYVYVDPSGVGIANSPLITSQSVYLENQTGAVRGGIQFNTDGQLRLYVSASGQIKFNRYLTPFSFPGTPIGSLSYDAVGNIITTPFSTSYISTGSITASVNADPTASFKVTSGSNTLLTLTNDSKLVIGTPGEFIDYQLEVSGAIKAYGNVVVDSSQTIASTLYGTGQLVTASADQPTIYLDCTWDTSANARGIEYNVTNTASGISSSLLNLKIDNASVFKVSKGGTVQTTEPGGSTIGPQWKLGIPSTGTITPDTYITIEINGQIYSIPALTGTP